MTNVRFLMVILLITMGIFLVGCDIFTSSEEGLELYTYEVMDKENNKHTKIINAKLEAINREKIKIIERIKYDKINLKDSDIFDSTHITIYTQEMNDDGTYYYYQNDYYFYIDNENVSITIKKTKNESKFEILSKTTTNIDESTIEDYEFYDYEFYKYMLGKREYMFGISIDGKVVFDNLGRDDSEMIHIFYKGKIK